MFFTELFALCAIVVSLVALKSNNWVKSVGKLTIFDVADRQSLFGNSMKVIRRFEYQYEHGNRSYVGRRIYPFGFGPIGWEVGAVLRDIHAIGQQIDIFVDPVNPSNSSIVNKFPYGLLTIFGVTTLVGLGASCFALVVYQLNPLRTFFICLAVFVPALLVGFLIYKIPTRFLPEEKGQQKER